MSSDDVAIRVSNLGKCYQIYDKPRDRLLQSLWRDKRQYYREFWALRDVSFEVTKGEIVGIIGRNGSGKSTLLQLIAGTLRPTHGSADVNGRVAALLELGSGFNAEFTGRENVFINGAVLGLSQGETERRFDEIAEFANLGDFIDQPVKTYSSGMLVRLAFAVSVCVAPEVLLMDEALAVGDAGFQFKCLDRLQQLAEKGTTLLLVSHDMGMVKRFCHRVIYLQQGRERARGAPDEVVELYWLDLRDEHRRGPIGEGEAVTVKPFLGRRPGIAFGTDAGRIVSACFTNTNGMASSYMTGEVVEIKVQVQFRRSLPRPCLSILIQDRRMLELGGKSFPITRTAEVDGWHTATLGTRFRANLAAGRYHITVRLESRDTDRVFWPVDKQVGLLSFEVLQSGSDFLGAVDLGLEMA